MQKQSSETNIKPYYNDICNKISSIDNFILMTGGIGDLLAMDYFKAFPQEFSSIVDLSIKPYIKTGIYNLIFPRKEVISFWHIHPGSPAALQKQSVQFCLSNKKLFHNYYLQYFIKNELKEINVNSIFDNKFITFNFSLPKKYIAIHPTSINTKNYVNRNFTSKDWQKTIETLEFNKMYGVVLGLSQKVPQHSLLINLTNMTNILESIEIVKEAIGFIGISSVFSVVAARFINSQHILIKNNSKWCSSNLEFYYPLHKQYKFVQKSINKVLNFIKFI